MADEETRELLNEWGLSCLEESLKDNLIDIETLRILNDQDLRSLIKPIGLMVKFRERRKMWLETLAVPNSDQMNIAEESDIQILFDDSTPSTSNASNEFRLLDDLKVIEDTGTSDSTAINQQLSIITPSSNLDLLLALDTNFVEKILKASVSGRALLASGILSGGLLTESQRKELGRLIINKIVDDDPHGRIQSVAFTRLSLQIVNLFPKEAGALYSIPSTSGTNKKNASGILYEVYVNRRRKLREKGILPKRVRSRSNSLSSSTPPASLEAIGSPEAEEHLTWLTNCIEPWGTVEAYWNETEGIRLSQLKEKGNLIDYFSTYPCLKQHQGYKLLLQDFASLHPGKENYLFNNVLIFKDKIIALAKEKERNSRDKDYKGQLKQLLTTASDTESPNKLLATLLLITSLLNVKPVFKKNGKTYKPSRSEVEEAFVTFVSDESNLLPVIEERKNKYERFGLTLQPLVVLVGSVTEVNKSKVVVDKTVYDLPSAIEAIDVAFKIVHATNALYQVETEQIWLFIQIAFYGITTKFDRLTQNIRHLLSDFEVRV